MATWVCPGENQTSLEATNLLICSRKNLEAGCIEDFLISFLEIVHLKGCLGGISDNLNFRTYLRFSIFSDIGS